MNRRTLARSLAIPVAIAIAPGSLLAADRDPVAADGLFQQGRTEAAAGQYAQACPRFEESYRLDPTVGTLLNLADCTEHLGRIGAALAYFTEAAKKLANGDDRMTYVQERIAHLRPRIPRLTIVASKSDGVKIVRDQVEVGPGALNMPLSVEPGRHVIVVRALGHKDREIVVDLPEGAEREVRAEPGEPLPAAPGSGTASSSVTGGNQGKDVPETRSRNLALPLLVSGIGVAGIAVGGVAGMLAIDRASVIRDACGSARLCTTEAGYRTATDAASSGKTFSTLSTVGFGVGVAGLAVATYLWLRPSSAKEPMRTGLWLLPLAGPSGAGVAASGRFE